MTNENGQTLTRKQKKKLDQLTKQRRRNVIIVMVEVVLLLLLSIGCYGVNVLSSYQREELSPSIYLETLPTPGADETEYKIITKVLESTNEEGSVVATEIETSVEAVKSQGYRNILILGIDTVDQEEFEELGHQTDVIIIASINNATGDVKLVSVLRDTIFRMEPGTSTRNYEKANHQFAVTSSPSQVVSMINRNLGLDIQDYILINWYGVAKCVNQLGGIELTIPDETILSAFNGYLSAVNEATGIWAPQFSEPGTYLMSGTQVVAFCRIRQQWYDEGRTENQRVAIGKILEKAKSLMKSGQFSTLLNVAQTGLGNVKTNLSLGQLLDLVMRIGDFRIAETRQFPIEYAGGEKEIGNYLSKYHVDWPNVAIDFAQEVKDLHTFLFPGQYYFPSNFINTISKEMENDRLGK